MSDWRATPIDSTTLSNRAKHSLQYNGYYSLGDVALAREIELLRCPNLGRVSIAEVATYIHDNFGAVMGEQRDNLVRLREKITDRIATLQRDLADIEKRLSA